MNTLYRYNILMAIVLLTGCIELYEPQIKNTDPLLVVEGILIESEGTYIRLGITKNFSETGIDYNNGENYLNKAEVYIQCSDGSSVKLKYYSEEGNYIPEEKIVFKDGATYTVNIMLNGKQYRSEELIPLRTPPVEEVNYVLQNDGTLLDIRVSTHDPEGKIMSYRWAYEEDWEIKASYFSFYYYDPVSGKIMSDMTYDSPNNRYYCWGKDVSTTAIVGSSERISGGIINNKSIKTINQSDYDTRFTYLYSILVKQYAIEQQAYEYFENMRKNLEQKGSIFSPIPSNMEGNIHCITNTGEQVIGFITASTETNYRLYIPVENVPSMMPLDKCSYSYPGVQEFYSDTIDPSIMHALDLGIAMSANNGYIWKPVRCVDCTKLYKGTKNKPAFWPNNHI